MKYKSGDKFAGISIFSSEISDGQMSLGTLEGRENANKFLKKIGSGQPLSHMAQVYSNRIEVVETPGLFEGIDGLVTREKLTLGVKSSDCIPVMIYDPKSSLIGAIHAGREPLTKGILSDSLGQILEKQNIDPGNLLVFLGPHIRVDSYPLRKKSVDELSQTKWFKYLKKIDGKLHFDLTEAAKAELVKTGVLAENMYDCGIDTFKDSRFFSFRRRPETDKVENFLTVVFKNETTDKN